MYGGNDDIKIEIRDDEHLELPNDDQYDFIISNFIKNTEHCDYKYSGGKKKIGFHKIAKKLPASLEKNFKKSEKMNMIYAKKHDKCVCKIVRTKCRKCRNDYKV